jgi:hypothetical protein
VSVRWDGGSWVGQTLLICIVTFPLADPILHALGEPLARVSALSVPLPSRCKHNAGR